VRQFASNDRITPVPFQRRAFELDIKVDYVKLVDGERAALRAVKDVKGGGHTSAMTGAIVATSLVFFPAAPLFLFVKGKGITIPKGTEVTAFVSGNMPLKMANFRVWMKAPQLQPPTREPLPNWRYRLRLRGQRSLSTNISSAIIVTVDSKRQSSIAYLD
jgi:hypothetical protein